MNPLEKLGEITYEVMDTAFTESRANMLLGVTVIMFGVAVVEIIRELIP